MYFEQLLLQIFLLVQDRDYSSYTLSYLQQPFSSLYKHPITKQTTSLSAEL